MPAPAEGIDEENVVGEGNHGVVHDVGVFQVDGAVLDVVAGVEEQLSVSVELQGLGRLVDLVGPLEIFGSSLSQFSLRSVYDFVQILHLSESSSGLESQLFISPGSLGKH